MWQMITEGIDIQQIALLRFISESELILIGGGKDFAPDAFKGLPFLNI